MVALLTFRIDEHDTTTALGAVRRRGVDIDVPVYVYAGPLGPVQQSHFDDPPTTVLWGDHVPRTRLALGAPARTHEPDLALALAEGIAGSIGTQALSLRSTDDGAIAVVVGDARYELRGGGMLPRVSLFRDDLTEVVVYSVLGRRPHRIVAEPGAHEVVLAIVLARFVDRVAYRTPRP